MSPKAPPYNRHTKLIREIAFIKQFKIYNRILMHISKLNQSKGFKSTI